MDPDHRRQLSLLLGSPRVAPGLLSAAAWEALRSADEVLTRDLDAAQPTALAAAGVRVTPVPAAATTSPQALARHLLDRASRGPVVWVGAADGDPGLAESLAVELPDDDPPGLELLVGSWDTPGARLLDAVAVMDRLRSPGGCPWDARQTHASLTPYLVEEAYEAVEALEVLDQPDADRDHAAEELGDVLLQVLFHARVAAEHEDDPFDIDDVAAGLVDKLVRRHPHVFSDVVAATPEAVEANWEQIKGREKPHREHALDGISAGMPELDRATKVASRLRRAGRSEWLRGWVDERLGRQDPGAILLDALLDLHDGGVDASVALRHTLRELDRQARERAGPA